MPADLTVAELIAVHAAGKLVLDIGESGPIPRMQGEAGTHWRRELRRGLAAVSRELAAETFVRRRK